MKCAKSFTPTKTTKRDREQRVLLGLVAYYIKTGKPVGSHSLQEEGFDDLSTATIRNYFAQLENEGYLLQLHASGGRIPTEKAYRWYAGQVSSEASICKEDRLLFQALRTQERREVSLLLKEAAEQLSHLTQTAVFFSAPRFEHDLVADIKLVLLDARQLLCVLVTEFGVIRTELLHSEKKLGLPTLHRMESYFRWRLSGTPREGTLSPQEELLAQQFYNEVMVRHLVGYSHCFHEEIFRSGFSELLAYPEFGDAPAVANGLALFENASGMRLLLRQCTKSHHLRWWVGTDLSPVTAADHCAVIAHPYCIGPKAVGSFGLLGPTRLPYPRLFSLLSAFCEALSEVLTHSTHRFQITLRHPHSPSPLLTQDARLLPETTKTVLLEDRRSSPERSHTKVK